jgi:hypothetical protein
MVALGLLGGVWAERTLWRPSATESEAYHQLIRQEAESLPIHIGTWLGAETPVPPSAVKLLRPNVIISRGYQDVLSGRRVAVLLVHCKDARDLLGHWPPVCYVGQGWTLVSSAPQDWESEGLRVAGMRHEFASHRAGRPSRLSVDNFFILPGGRTCRDMDEVDAIARDPRRKLLGAAQVQVVSDGALGGQERDEVLAMFIGAARPVIDAIGQGVSE